MNIKSIALFFGGVVVGGTAGVFGTKKYFQNKFQKKYEEDNKALEEYDKYARIYHDEDKGEPKPVEEDSKPGGRMTQEERAYEKIKRKLERNWKETTNYAGMYKIKSGTTETVLSESQHPLDQGEYGEEDPICSGCIHGMDGVCKMGNDEKYYSAESVDCDDFKSNFESNTENTLDQEDFENRQKNITKPPKIISADAYSDLGPGVTQEVLYYYTEDEMLTDENEEPINEPEAIIGDALTKYGFNDSNETIIFVMNYALDTCYEIQKVNTASYK